MPAPIEPTCLWNPWNSVTAGGVRKAIIGFQLVIQYCFQWRILAKAGTQAGILLIRFLMALPSLSLVDTPGLLVAACLLSLVVCCSAAARLLAGLGLEGMPHRLAATVRVWGLGLFIAAGSLETLAQTLPPDTAADQVGLRPYQSYHGGDIDAVSLPSGLLNLHYPFLSYSQRGLLQLPFDMLYNTAAQQTHQVCESQTKPPTCVEVWGVTPSPSSGAPAAGGGVGIGLAQGRTLIPTLSSVVINQGLQTQQTWYYARWSVADWDGATHPLGNLGTQSLQGSAPYFYTVGTGPWETLDGTGIRVNGSLTTPAPTSGNTASINPIIDSSGVVSLPGSIQDPDGNQITFVNDSNGVLTALNDTLGRQIPLPPSTQSPSNTDNSGCPQSLLPVHHAVLWSVPGPNSGTAAYKFCYAVVPINIPETKITTTDVIQGVVSNSVQLQSIVLPDGHAWNFQYNDPGDGSTYNGSPVNYGTLTQITLPMGGTISYSYSGEFGRLVATRTVNANDGTGPHTWTYSYGTQTGTAGPITNVATVTDPLRNYVVHTFAPLNARDPNPSHETQTQYFQAGGALLKTVSTAYQSTPGGPSSNSNGPTNVVPTQITTVWPLGQTQTVTKSYNTTGFSYISFGGEQINPYTNAPYAGIYGKEISESVSDWGSGGPGPTLMTTNTNYLAFSNSSYLAANMLDLVSSKTVTDGTGCKVAETDYTYDEPAYLTTYPGALPSGSFGNPPNSPPVLGHQTTVTHQLFPAGTCPTSAQAGPTSHTNWYNTGEVYRAIDALANTTTHNYDPALGGAYPTKTTNALNQAVGATYDFNTGLMTSFTDPNGNTASLNYDSMRRPTSIFLPKDPAGNQAHTLFNYSPAGIFPVTVQRLKSVTPAMDDSLTTTLDGLGRPAQTQHATPQGNATVATNYDANGRVASVTNPYFTTSDPTYGVTSPQYDGIGRVIQITKQDGSIVTTQYNQPASTSANADCTTSADEAGNQRRTCNDGIGQLIEVDEPGDSFSGAQANGSITVNGTLQSTQVIAQAGTPGTGGFSITDSNGGSTGGDRTEAGQSCTTTCTPPPRMVCTTKCSPTTIYDTGTVSVTVNGFTASTSYGQNSTPSSIASDLASGLNASGSPVTATVSGNTVTMTAATTSASTDYSWSTTSATNKNFTGTSFPVSPASGTLSGGQNPVYNSVYDAGSVSLSVGSFTSPAVPYGQNSNNTAAQVAAALAQALTNASGSPVHAAASGAAINITYNSATSAGNVGVSCNASTSQGAYFSASSFSCPGTALGGGTDPYPSGVAHPYITLYSYDALANLKQVNQQGDGSQAARVRSFTYDSLSRLTQAVNPESGTINYSYDANGNLLQKTSPAPNQTGTATQVISYCYDPLNRVQGKAYSVQSCPLNSPAVSYTYDGGANGIGHLTSSTDQAGSASYVYDPLGRILSESRTTAGITKTMSYGYYLDSSINTLTYPSNAVITYTPWNNSTIAVAGTAQSAVDQGNGINYITAANYEADLQGTGFTSGNSGSFAGITNSFSYNTRMQPVSMSAASPTQTVFSIGYDFHAGNGTAGSGSDNGNVYALTNNKDPTRSQSFTYDTLNRLISAQNAGTDCTKTVLGSKTEYWGNNYGYDPWGNLLSKTVTKCSGENLNVTALANNQLSGYGYDAAGNMTHDSTSGLNYSYDQESRITGAGGFTYTYDADGSRVEKSNGSTGTLYWYMTPGIVAETDLAGNLQSEYMFFDGERVARKDYPSNAVSYYFSDHLKTTDIVTDAQGNIKNESEYYPWAGELSFSANDSNHYKFTGKERDAETQLDYFGARYYSNGLGRFVTPDWAGKPTAVPYAHYGNPQSFNLYSYVNNNPTTTADPDGHCPWCPALALAGGGVLADEAPLAFTGPVGWTVIGVTAIGIGGYALYQHFHNSDNSNAHKNPPPASTEQGRDAQGKFLPKQPGQTQPGADAEKAALKAEGATKTGTTLPGTTRKVDGTVTSTGQKIEVKSGERVDNTGQLVQAGQATQTATGQPLLVVTTNPNVTVSAPAQQNPNLQIRPVKKTTE